MTDYIFGAIASFCLLASLLPLLPISHGVVRIFDFGRLQIATIAILTAIILSLSQPDNSLDLVFLAMLLSAFVIQAIFIIRFTPLWFKQSAKSKTNADDETVIRFLICNVKQGNRDYSKLIELLRECEPDIFILMETDQAWTDAINDAFSHYPHTLTCPQDNSYGMFLASRLDMISGDIKFLLNDKIPSFHCTFRNDDDQQFDLISIHPDPPVPNSDTMGRDAEILIAGKIAIDRKRPMIITGDLNDVAWSATTRRFMRLSQLLDPRQGRGMYNSFDARFPFLRWPLDHIFHSEEFELVNIMRQPFIGSDHFPMMYELALNFSAKNTTPPDATKDDFDEAKEVIDTEKKRDRNPVGEDWEK
ncbi:endonuclease/exonuclease/phosphatase family protein [Sneathiella aquimaris]|uniref:endonuclease/exonuclease/phosphatase family protein n=1 Tax=Sneathiella aquimaris TaxID=2599305 RepID=UPI00146B74A5|nr:endonuclease/exonuclease/phosphatase family protein [Sneathiella aquimaris]